MGDISAFSMLNELCILIVDWSAFHLCLASAGSHARTHF